jgi:hypothetical protein
VRAPLRVAVAGPPCGAPSVGVTAREIAHGTGLSLSSVYRALHELGARRVVVWSWPPMFPALKPERRPQA